MFGKELCSFGIVATPECRGWPMRKRSAIGAAVVGLIGAVVPAISEDAGIYSFIHSEARERSYASPPVRVTPQFAPRPLQLTPRQRVTKPAIARAPARAVARVPAKAVAEEHSPKIERDPKTIGEVSNPLPTLLRDETLRPGDMVMFPDGVRVFRGKPGSRHELVDFVKLSATKRLAASDRKLLARIVVGQNSAWSFDTGQPGRVAEKTREIGETGSTRRSGRRR